MPIILPAGTVPTFAPLTDLEVLVAGVRATSWRWEVLDRHEVLLGELAGVQPGGSADWTASASIKGGGQVTIIDAPDEARGDQLVAGDLDWLNIRLRPVCTIDGYSREIPVGVWLPSAPVATWTDLGRTWEVELLDKGSILDGDVWRHPTSGRAETYVATAGSNVISLVRTLIIETGELVPAIEVATSGPTTTRDMVWEAGTTRLKIINDLLDAAGYFSLWVDHAGQYRTTPYAPPAARAPAYVAVAPFTEGPTSVMDPAFSHDRDIFSVPNQYVCIGQGSADAEALTSIAVNTDPASPYSYLNRGRWVTRVETGVEAVNQAALDLICQRKLDAATAVTSKLDLTHLFLPDLQVNTTIRCRHDQAGIDLLCVVTKTTVSFDPLGTCTSRLQEVPTS